MTELLYKDITFDIRGACFAVWNEFGGAFKEKVIERALAIELQKRGRKVETQKVMPIFYEGSKIGTYIPDQIVDEVVLVEIKSKEFITAEDYDQFWKYLKGSKYKVGLLINFGPKKLEIKRIVYEQARSASYPRKQSALKSAEKGFTLIEIIVATTIFAVVVAAMMALFNYTLKINRRTEALRQATQGMRSFVEFLVKEVKNGDIDYGVISGQKTGAYPLGPCDLAGGVGTNTYSSKSNWLGITTTDNEKACIYFADYQGNPFAGDVYSCSAPSSQNCTLVMEKYVPGGPNIKEIINPPNYRIDSLAFFVRPVCDPFSFGDPINKPCPAWGSNPAGLPKVQPSVTIAIKFIVNLPTGESVPIYYQTTIASGRADIPSL